MVSPSPIVPLSALEHYEYCPRQCALIHVDAAWEDNAHTVRGHYGHRRVDSGQGKVERGKTVLRSIPLWSETYGLSGRADAVEIDADGRIAPVEYKIGRRHGRAADIQLCAQAMCVEEMSGTTVDVGFLWVSATRHRVTVAIDSALRDATIARINDVRGLLRAQNLPPAPNDLRCEKCQFLTQCLPDVVARRGSVDHYLAEVLFKCES